jgi:ATP-dependent RNA helicase DeaD
MEKFRKLGIHDDMVKVIEEEKFEKPSEIQEKTIPLILSGKDVIAGAATGSGKTLAFAAGIIQNTKSRHGIQTLVLVPTRELAEQVSRELKKFSKHNALKIIAVYGGVSIGPQIENLEDVEVVVGTPGRIIDHIQRRTIDLNNVKILVLDEADRMLDMGFRDDVEKIVRKCPTNRQTMLFSATISDEISRLARKYMVSPIEVSAEQYVDPSKLTQIYYDTPDNMKFALLVHLLKGEHPGLIMVFCNTQRNTDFVARNLQNCGINAIAIHGGLSQDKRTRIMKMFNSKQVSVLVCTDVAARGLDIKGVSHIYNYDTANESDNYIHRIGRTARAGKDGKAVSIIASRDYENFSMILKRSGFEIRREEMPLVDRVNLILPERREGGRFGQRGGGDNRGRFGGRRDGGRNFSRGGRGGGRFSRHDGGGRGGGRSWGGRR